MDAQVVRWRKYGKDRLYVTAGEGIKLGHHDLMTGLDHLAEVGHADAFQAALAAWRTSAAGKDAPPVTEVASAHLLAGLDGPAHPEAQGSDAASARLAVPVRIAPAPALEGGEEVSVLQPEPTAQWEDLAQRRAGEMARVQAVALKQAAPVRTMVARVLGVHTDERAWRIGADGEQKVAGQLAKLAKKDPRWHYLHAVPVGVNGADIDHLVIGPGGVFSLNAKHHPGGNVWVGGNTLMINGQRQPYIRNSRHEAQRASRLLTAACGFLVPVTGMVVPVGANNITIKTPPDDVHVVNRMALSRWLRARAEVLSLEHLEAVYGAARRSTTWQPAT